MFSIYALVDPATGLVRYVGRTRQSPYTRHRQHCGGKDPATRGWVKTLTAPPALVLLETGESRRVVVGQKGTRKVRPVTTDSATVAETKWLKRFRRTVINRRVRDNCAPAWDQLVNPEDACREQ